MCTLQQIFNYLRVYSSLKVTYTNYILNNILKYLVYKIEVCAGGEERVYTVLVSTI